MHYSKIPTTLLSTLFVVLGFGLSSGCGDGLDVDPRDGSGHGDGGDGSSSMGDSSADRCAQGVDSDRDGVPNDVECAAGSDPYRSDSDDDGVSDGTEINYPRICVATDPMRQRRPPVRCTGAADCMTGEDCRGLNPTSADSDGDGVPDGTEDRNGDGMIDTAMGETDPRLTDTDGDGMPDARRAICEPTGLAMVTQAVIAPGAIQVGHDPAFGTGRTVMVGTTSGAVLLDDAAANVSALVASIPAMGDVRAESTRVEGIVSTALGAGTSAVLLGRSIITHELNDGITSTYRVARATSASALRDAIVMPLVGGAAVPGPVVGMSAEFLVDVTTVRRTMGSAMGRTDVMVSIAPRSDYDNLMRPTAIRASDLVNSTAVAEASRSLGFACQAIRSEGAALVDFLWTVDVSPSMGPYQVQVGNTGDRFFRDLRTAGVDFRVAVLAAQSVPFNFTMPAPGLQWVASTNPMGSTELSYRVTVERYMAAAADRFAPYPNNGMYTLQLNEEPIAAAIIAYEQLQMGAMTGAPPDHRLRAGAQTIAFFVADETGANDQSRYFQRNTARWGATYPLQLAAAINFFRTNRILTFGLVNTVAGVPMCDMTRSADMRRCVILGAGGAWIPIGTATDADVAAAMARIVAAVAGSSSQFRLTRTPITSTLKVQVRGMNVPRSRADGFDYDPASRAIVFYGTTYRPVTGNEVVISYRVWEGSLG